MHTKGGWMYYEYVGPGSAANTNKYRITLKLYTACVLTQGQFDPTINFIFFDAGTHQQISSVPVTYTTSDNIQNCSLQQCHPCVNLIPDICYKITTYTTEQDLPLTTNGYVVSYQRCCRIGSIINLTPPSNNVGETWTVTIPGNAVAGAQLNSSAQFAQNDTAIICQNAYFTFDFSATDPDNDSLAYVFTPAYGGLSPSNPTGTATAPPYSPVAYESPFSGYAPLGNLVSINPRTGIVSGIAPDAGTYVVTVVCYEYRRGTNIKVAEVRKSLHIQVADCSSTKPKLDPVYFSCDGFTQTFTDVGDLTNIQTFFWDFGDGDTSNAGSQVVHTYLDTGVYTLKLVVNRNQQCSDSSTALVKVFPGFLVGFTANSQCTGTPIQFTDTTYTRYGVVTPWSWDFGDPSSNSNYSLLQNPSHTYATAGNYTVTLIVGNSKGCVKTVTKTINVIDHPPLTVPPEMLICSLDTVQITAVGTGSFLWTPNYMISDVTSASPLISPDVTTTYRVTLTDAGGCVATDTVRVNVVNFVTLLKPNDSTVCTGDPIVLKIVSDGLHYSWTPTGSLNDPTLKNPIARPTSPTTTYHVVANIGKCVTEADIIIKTIPYPVAKAGLDQEICFGNSTQLQASGGSSYVWSPAIFLDSPRTSHPRVINPTSGVRYIVTVRDTLGCPKAVKDTMILTVDRVIAYLGAPDTAVVLGQPLQLNASGGINYLWTPSTWLDDPTIHNPVSLPQDNIRYFVRVSNNIGCFANGSIRVFVYKIPADLYVPTAFSPGGLNSVFRPILRGIKSLDLFRVYNRWGQMLYSNPNPDAGWDGSFGGRAQEAGTYVWYAEATDYKGTQLKKKGYVVLIR